MSDEAWIDPRSDAFFLRPLAEIIDVRDEGGGEFSAQLDGFGGVTLGCATRAAARTCPGRWASSVHGHFLRPVATDVRTRFRVEAVRDGRRLAHRRVQVRAGDKTACELFVAFANEAHGPSFQEAERDPDVPGPEGLESDAATWMREHFPDDPLGDPVEWRWIGVPFDEPEPQASSVYHGWVRPRVALPADEPGAHAGALAFLADFHSHIPIARRLGGPYDPSLGYTSLEQTVWIHRAVPWNDWWLATSTSDVAHAGRAITRRQLHDREGHLVASMVQEMMLLGTS